MDNDGRNDGKDELTPREKKKARRERLKKKRERAALFEKLRTEVGRDYENNDPLEVWDRYGCPTDTLKDHFRPVFGKVRSGFLCCGGPSAKKLGDKVKQLNLPGVASVGVNNAARAFGTDVAVWGDPTEKFHHGIHLDHKIIKLVPKQRLRQTIRIKQKDKWYPTPFRLSDCPNLYYFEKDQDFYPEKYLTTTTACWGINKKALANGNPREKMLNTFFLGLRLCHYLGIRRLFLLGVDFTMSQGAEYSWAMQSGNSGRANCNQNSYRIARNWCNELRPIFEDAGFNVFNCNPESHLDAFDYISFDDAITEAIGACPQEPYSLSGWYDKVDVDENWDGFG